MPASSPAVWDKSTSRRSFLFQTGASLAVGAMFAGMPGRRAHGAEQRATEGTAPLNILIVTADDMGPQLGCYGDPVARTPHLDKLAGEGVLFENAYVTQASCSPSRSSILTGLYPHQNGMVGLADYTPYNMKRLENNLPALLHRAGYRNGIVGKLHLRPNDQFPFPDMPFPTREDGSEIFPNATTLTVRQTVGKVKEFLGRKDPRPFFLYVNLVDPHRPFYQQHDGLPAIPVTPAEVKPLPFQGLDTPEIRQEVAGYYNGVGRADFAVGAILEALDACGKRDNTLVLFLGDNGPDFTRGKTTCYEGGIRVPMIVRSPTQLKGGCAPDRWCPRWTSFPPWPSPPGLPCRPGLPECPSSLSCVAGKRVGGRPCAQNTRPTGRPAFSPSGPFATGATN